MKKLTTVEFILKARSVHGDRWGYSHVNYVGAKTKVEILCPSHGVFRQTASNHLQGQICRLCYIDEAAINRRKTASWFIEKANQAHGIRYCYEGVEYRGQTEYVEIKCHQHGLFRQTPHNHINGKGCPKCGRAKTVSRHRRTSSQFIESSKLVHGDKWGYDHVDYTGYRDPVEITCPSHGLFFQKPEYHLRGSGCPTCFYGSPVTVVYIIKMALLGEEFLKVGVTSRAINKRFCNEIRMGASVKVIETATYSNPATARLIERDVHKTFAKWQYSPIVDFPGKTECFCVSIKDKLVTYLRKKV